MRYWYVVQGDARLFSERRRNRGLTVFDVVSLVKDEDGVGDVDVHGGANHGVDDVVVWAEHKLCFACMQHPFCVICDRVGKGRVPPQGIH